MPVSFDSPPLFSPLGALNGSWRRCGTLCCFQEALLNAVCPVALSPLFPLLSIEMYCIFCSHHKVQHYVASLQKKSLSLICFIKESMSSFRSHWFELCNGSIFRLSKQEKKDYISVCTAAFIQSVVASWSAVWIWGILEPKWSGLVQYIQPLSAHLKLTPPRWRRRGIDSLIVLELQWREWTTGDVNAPYRLIHTLNGQLDLGFYSTQSHSFIFMIIAVAETLSW